MKRVTPNSVSKALAAALAAAAVATNAADKTNNPAEFRTFDVVVKRNIFNASRSGRDNGQRSRPEKTSRVDTISLLGTMNYEKGSYAFFGSSDSRYRKSVGLDEEVAGFKVTEITYDCITLSGTDNRAADNTDSDDEGEKPQIPAATNSVASLASTNLAAADTTNELAKSDTNAAATTATPVASASNEVAAATSEDKSKAAQSASPSAEEPNKINGRKTITFKLAVGSQLKRVDGGPWTVSEHSDSSASSSTAPATTSSDSLNPGGANEAENEILKRLMKKREQELNK